MATQNGCRKSRPKGSGWFAAIFGMLFLVALVCSNYVDIVKISPIHIFRVWLFFSAAVLIVWGCQRIKKGKDSNKVGQSTIQFVVAFVAVTLTILSLILE